MKNVKSEIRLDSSFLDEHDYEHDVSIVFCCPQRCHKKARRIRRSIGAARTEPLDDDDQHPPMSGGFLVPRDDHEMGQDSTPVFMTRWSTGYRWTISV